MSSARAAMVGLLDQIGAGKPLRRWYNGRRKVFTPLVPKESFAACCRIAIDELANHGHEFGDYLEFGVSRGTSFAAMHDVLLEKGLNSVRLFGFDSFKGLPPEAKGEGWPPGHFYSAISATRKYLTEQGIDCTRSTLVMGWFKDTLNNETIRKFNIERASLIMVDCDIYSASRDALWFSQPLIRHPIAKSHEYFWSHGFESLRRVGSPGGAQSEIPCSVNSRDSSLHLGGAT